MPRYLPLHLLSAREVQVAGEGWHPDGGGLYLRVVGAACSWVLRYRAASGKRRAMGLGHCERGTIDQAGASLARARERALRQLEVLEDGEDPVDIRDEAREDARQAEQQKKAQAQADHLTLARAARDYHARVIEPRFTDKHAQRWISSLEISMPERIWHKPIDRVTPVELYEVLAELRKRIPETVDKLRQRLDKVFDDAMFFGRCKSNPARAVRGKLSETPKGRREEHYRALPVEEVPAFLIALHQQPGSAARALEFALFTAARSAEALGVVWEEIDERTGVWRLPAERMKGREPHVVALPPQALAVLEKMKCLGGLYVFPSPRGPTRRLSNMAMLEVLKRMGYIGRTTVHGVCRASFSTWANDTDAARPDVIEACLAHRETDLVRAAYNRAAFHAERAALLRAWADYCEGKTATSQAGPEPPREDSTVIALASRGTRRSR